VLATAFSQSLDLAQATIFVIIILAGATAYFFPAAKMTTDLSGWEVGAIVFGLIIAVRLLLSPYWIWKEDQDAISDAKKRIHELQAKLDDRERRKNIRIALSGFHQDGMALMSRCENQIIDPPPTADAKSWAKDVETFLRNNLNESYVSRFNDGTNIVSVALIPQPPKDHFELWERIRVRVINLNKFMEVLSRD
jgi:hypothetical protein